MNANMYGTWVTTLIIFSSFIYLTGSKVDGQGADSSQSNSSGTGAPISQEEAKADVSLADLPGASDTFDQIRIDNKCFIDKSLFIRQLLKKKEKLFMITRPKRFGKSVFLQMLQRFFEGEKRFFLNTDIAQYGNKIEEDGKWTRGRQPVIYIDFDGIQIRGKNGEIVFATKLEAKLRDIAKLHKKFSTELLASENFDIGQLITGLKKACKKRVIILIDNYDTPLMSMENPIERKIVFGILNEFYRLIRANVDDVRLAFVVGLSVLNIVGNSNARFEDLSFDKDFVSIMGFTEDEINRDLKPYLLKNFVAKKLQDKSFKDEREKSSYEERIYDETKKKIQTWYGGHRFGTDGKQLVNPSSACACLRKQEFRDHMGSSQIISEIQTMMRKKQVTLTHFEHYPIRGSFLKSHNFKIGEIPLPVFLYCTGFLTITQHEPITDTVWLNYPNKEIRDNLRGILPQDLIGNAQTRQSVLANCVETNDMERMVYFLNQINFENLSHNLVKSTAEYLATDKITASLKAAGIAIADGELLIGQTGPKVRGDLDFQMQTPGSEHVVSVKYMQSVQEAIEQYICYILLHLDAFQAQVTPDIDNNKRIFLVGINVKSKEMKTLPISDWVSIPYDGSMIRVDLFNSSINIKNTFKDGLKKKLEYSECLKKGGKTFKDIDKIIVWSASE